MACGRLLQRAGSGELPCFKKGKYLNRGFDALEPDAAAVVDRPEAFYHLPDAFAKQDVAAVCLETACRMAGRWRLHFRQLTGRSCRAH